MSIAAPVLLRPSGIALSPDRLRTAKFAFTTRRVPPGIARALETDASPRAGDLVLARVDELGEHQRLERPDGRRARIFPGDEIVVCFGNRYAPDQFEAVVPDDLSSCHLVAAGGLAAQARLAHRAMKEPTLISPIGLLLDAESRRANVADWALAPMYGDDRPPLMIAVVGTAMNAGKTTAAAGVVRGLVARGMRVGAAKVTGTGAGGDVWLIGDAGASPVLDFTDAGLPSSYLAPPEIIERCLRTLLGHIARAGVDAAVLEVADGLFQQETAALLSSPLFAAAAGAVIFASGDALGAAAGVEWLRARGLPVVAVSGLLTRSPLATREAERATDLPILSAEDLRDPVRVGRVLPPL